MSLYLQKSDTPEEKAKLAKKLVASAQNNKKADRTHPVKGFM